MKRRISTIFTAVFIFMACIFVSACGDKYGKMDFVVQYAYSNEESAVWHNVENDLIETKLGTTEDSLQMKDGRADLYIRVQLTGVKEKHVGRITISKSLDTNNALVFTSRNVQQNEVVSVGVINVVKNSSLLIYENNSGKSKSIQLKVFRELDHIEVRDDIIPAMSIHADADELNLNGINNLKYLSKGYAEGNVNNAYVEGETNELGVNYKLLSIGHFSSGNFVENQSIQLVENENDDDSINSYVIKSGSTDLLELKNGILTLLDTDKTFFKTNLRSSYAVKIRAISKYYEDETDGKYEDFYVYLVEGNESAPMVNFVEGDESHLIEDGTGIHLYQNSDYSSTKIELVANSNNSNIYRDGVEIEGGKIVSYEPVFYVGDGATNEEFTKYDFTNPQGLNGLVVTPNVDGTFEINVKNRIIKKQNIKIGFELVGLTISNAENIQAADRYKEISVTKSILPKDIVASGVDAKNPVVNIYTYQNSNGYDLTLMADPTAYDGSIASEKEDVFVRATNGNLVITRKNGQALKAENDYYTIKSGETINVKFASDSVVTSTDLIIRTLKVPKIYNGRDLTVDSSIAEKDKYASMTINFKQIVTADEVQFYSNMALTDRVDKNSEFWFAESDSSEGYSVLYAKVKSSKDMNFESLKTLELTSNDNRVKFANGKSSITFNEIDTVDRVSGDDYTVFKIKVSDVSEDVRALLTLKKGDQTLDPIIAQSKDLFDIESLDINVAEDSKYKAEVKDYSTDIAGDSYKYAIPRGKTIEFSVADKNKSNGISKIMLSAIEYEGLENDAHFSKNVSFDHGDIIKGGIIYVSSIDAGKTHVVNVQVDYYTRNAENEVVIGTNYDENKDADCKLELAVYNPISNVVLSTNNANNEITYVNELYKDAEESNLNLNFRAINSYGDPTQCLYFANTEKNDVIEKKNISYMTVSLVKEGSNDNTINGLVMKYNNEPMAVGAKIFDFNGKVELGLEGNIYATTQQFKVVFDTYRFEAKDSSVTGTITIKVSNVDYSKGLVLKGRDIVEVGNTSNLNLSFLNKADKIDSKEFDVEILYGNNGGIQYSDLVYKLYEYEVDENGDKLFDLDELGNKIYRLYETSLSERLNVVEDDLHFTVSAKTTGGRYRLDISTKDSYDSGKFQQTKSIEIFVGDGSEQYEYVVSNKTEFYYINQDMSAYYRLGDNIDLGVIADQIDGHTENTAGGGQSVKPFIGGLDGSDFTLKYTIANKSMTTDELGDVVALFTILGDETNEAKIQNINLDVTFVTGSTVALTTEETSVNVAGFAGIVKNAEIDNSFLYINDSTIKLGEITKVYMGGFAAQNAGNISNLVVEYAGQLKVESQGTITNGFFGGVLGKNTGSVQNGYLGKGSLDEISIDLFVDMVFDIQNGEYNIGAVAGESSNKISNMLVSGKLVATTTGSYSPTGYLGGIAGKANGEISTIAVLALDINQNITSPKSIAPLGVAGVAGSADHITLTNAKVISVELEYEQNKYVHGAIKGARTVAGLIANGTNVTVTNSSVENFVKTQGFYTLIGDKVYGLVQGSGTVSNSFVLADLYATTSIDVTTNATEKDKDTYFVGNTNTNITPVYTDTKYAVINGETIYNAKTDSIAVENIVISSASKTISLTSTTKNEIITNGYKRIYILEDNKYVKQDINELQSGVTYYYSDKIDDLYIAVLGGESGNEITSYIPVATLDTIDKDANVYTLTYNSKPWSDILKQILNDSKIYNSKYDINYIQLINKTDKNEQVHIYLPYLVDENGEALMVLAPTDMSAKIDVEYINKTHSVYGGEYKYEKENIKIDEFAIINYYDRYTENNTWELGDLIDLSFFPEEAQGGIKFEIIGSVLTPARIDGTKITFYGLTGNTPIIVRCYSIFNPEVERFVAFYTELGISKLTIDSYRVTEENATDYNYLMNLYSGDRAQLINVGGENVVIKDDIEYSDKTIFDSVELMKSGYVELVVSWEKDKEDENEDKILQIDQSGFDLELSLREGAEFNTESYIDVELKLILKAAYLGDIVDHDIVIKTTTLRVVLHKSATSIDIDADHFDMYTNGNLTIKADMVTGFMGGTVGAEEIKIENNELVTVDNDKDTIRLSIEKVSDENNAFEELLKANDLTAEEAIKLFDITVDSAKYEKNKKQVGYSFSINLKMKDEFDIRYITGNIVFRATITAGSNPDVTASTTFTIMPAMLSTSRIENYSVVKFDPYSNYQNLVTNEYTENPIVAPGGAGSVMMIYLEPEYADVDEITISSQKVNVPTLGAGQNPVYLRYTQYVYDPVANAYLSYFGPDKEYQDNDTTELKLHKASRKDENGNIIYDGVIYVHVQLVRFEGYETSIRSYVDIKLGNGETRNLEKVLITSYMPGAYMEYEGIHLTNKNGYMIQDGTYGNLAELTIMGYQFNTNPDILPNWYIPDGSEIFYTNPTPITDITINGTKTAISSENFALALDIYGELWYQKDSKWYRATKYIDGVTTYYSVNDRSEITVGSQSLKIYNYVQVFLENDFDEVKYNANTDSYTMNVKFNVASNMPAAFTIGARMSLTGKDGQVVSANSDDIIFYPTKYVVTDVNVKGLNSNNQFTLGVNGSKYFELEFETINSSDDLAISLYDQLMTDIAGKYLSLFSYAIDGVEHYFNVDNAYFKIISGGNAGSYIMQAIAPISANAQFRVEAYYTMNSQGVLALKFRKPINGDPSKDNAIHSIDLVEDFGISITSSHGQDQPMPIYTASDMFNSDGTCLLIEGEHYILMADIDLTGINIAPIDIKIGSLDGNNKIIKIGGMLVNTENKTNAKYGLFASIGTYADGNETKQTILKNVIVDYAKFTTLSLVGNNITNIMFGGLVAHNEGGLIYNCDVINSNVSITKKVNIIVDSSTDVELIFGGLVGQNDGVVTNSRVGRDSYEKITPIINGLGVVTHFGALEFVIGDATVENISLNNFNVLAGGFVGQNNGTIASSFVTRTNLINYSTRENDSAFDNANSNQSANNKTAGFVAQNSGNIRYSYVSGRTYSNGYYIGSKIQNMGNGAVAGFVHNNSGNVDNSYANISLYTNSSYIAGFVYNNNSSGVISESYAACQMNASGVAVDKSVAEQPFVGMNDANASLSNGKLINTYFYQSSNVNYELDKSKDQARGLNRTNFSEAENLIGFDFVLSNSVEDRKEGIWSYYNVKNERRALPELMTANLIAHSCKFVDPDSSATNPILIEVARYASGTENNPHVISNVQEYKKIFIDNAEKDENQGSSFVGHVRFINDVSFTVNNVSQNVITKEDFTLGGDVNSDTSIEGNGMSISGIVLETQKKSGSIGLFGAIQNAYIRNLNLKYANNNTASNITSTTDINYVGGLAGTIDNSVIINVNLDGEGLILGGYNLVGGLAGKITGGSIVSSVTSNLGISVGLSSGDGIYGTTDATDEKLSYGGGLAGIIDISTRSNMSRNSYNVSYIEIRGDKMQDGISAQHAGGVAGYAGNQVNALKLKYYMGKNEKIEGARAVGGLFGVFSGSMIASQVTMIEGEAIDSILDATNQYEVDTAFGEYVTAVADQKADSKFENKDGRYGNLSLLSSKQFAGGLVGVSIGGSITSSYSKASISSGKYVGGVTGADIKGGYSYSYGASYVDLNKDMEYVGGLIGYTYVNKGNASGDLNTYIDDFSGKLSKASLNFVFATVFVDEEKLTNKGSTTIDYIVNYAEAPTEAPTVNNYVFYGNYVDGIRSNISSLTSEKTLKKLYNLSSSEHEAEFQAIFSTWTGAPYWTLDSSRYFPLLLTENISNYIKIENAHQFITEIGNNPKGNFEIVRDIDLSNKSFGNWVFGDVTFTGTIIGNRATDGGEPIISGMKLEAGTNGTMGFFKQTNGAHFSNLKFVWGSTVGDTAMNTNGKTIGIISGLSCEDANSEFVNVTVATYENGYFVKDGIAQGFGGIVGQATDSSISACNVLGNITMTLLSENSVYFGGLVAKSETNIDGSSGGAVTTEDVNESQNTSLANSRMAIISSSVGVNNNFDLDTGGNAKISVSTTSFNLTIADDMSAYVGGLIGAATNTAISGSSVGGPGYSEGYKRVTLNVTTKSKTKDLYFGGAIGQSEFTYITSVDINTDSTVNTEGTNNDTDLFVGGLVGSMSSGGQEIMASVADTKIKMSGNANSVTYGGIAGSVSEAKIDQTLATGSVAMEYTEGEAKTMQSNVTTAGGILGRVTETALCEVMSTVDMIVSGETVYAGGLVGMTTKKESGGCPITIKHALASGRIVPIVTGEENIELMAVGGLIGKVANEGDSITLTSAVTISSIVLDSLSTHAVKNMHSYEVEVHSRINSLIGVDGRVSSPDPYEDGNMSNVYYSSDFNLTSDSYEYSSAKNLTASVMITNAEDWRGNLNKEGSIDVQVWRNFKDSKGIPYISSLQSMLDAHSIIKIGEDKYTEGSALNPYSQYQANATDYCYYLISAPNNGLVKFADTLNGILILADSSSSNTPAANLGISKTDLNIATIKEISKHSAVSNLHLVLSGESNSSASDESNSPATGMIANTNSGMIYNCSVNGTGIKLDNTTKGLLVGTNDGMIMNSFSTAEILSTSKLGGIAGTVEAAGRIVSSYFTGYINGDGAGISTSCEGYLYNNYMAGVIKDGKDGDSSLSYSALVNLNNNVYGYNNYIDKLSNMEYRDTDEIKYVDAITFREDGKRSGLVVNSSDTQLLKGRWHTILDSDSGKLSEGTNTFARNYNYPVAKMNRSNGTDSNLETRYQTYTGTGEFVTAATSTTESTLLARANAIKDNSNNNYFNAMKIPHLGALQTVGCLIEDIDNFDRNYVITYEIDGTEYHKKSGVTWTSIKEFKGVIISNSNFDRNTNDDRMCTISNISGSALFGDVGNAYIGDINFANEFTVGSDAGIIGKNVTGETYLSNIDATNKVAVSGNDSLGGLFGTVNAKLTVETGVKLNIGITGDKGENNYVGLISGSLYENGIIKINKGNQFSVDYSECGTAGGIVGQIAKKPSATQASANADDGDESDPVIQSPSIIAEESITLAISNVEDTAKLGGIVGLANCSGKYAYVANIGVIFSPTNATGDHSCQYVADIFGGLVAESRSTIAFIKPTITCGTEFKVTAKTSGADIEKYYGMSVGFINGGTVIQKDFSISTGAKNIIFDGKNSSARENIVNQGVGYLIGKIAGNFAWNKTSESGGASDTSSRLAMSADTQLVIRGENIVNVGGIAGYYVEGMIAISVAAPTNTTIDGYMNVGGVFGQASSITGNIFKGFQVNTSTGEAKPISNGQVSALDEELGTTPDQNTTETYSTTDYLNEKAWMNLTISDSRNVGGLIGYAEDLSGVELTNANNITFAGYEGTFEGKTENIGGVVGKVTGAVSGTLTNEGTISFTTQSSNKVIDTNFIQNLIEKGSGTDGGPGHKFTVLPTNVGGIIGLVEGAQENKIIVSASLFNKLTDSNSIEGYMNVGGIIGKLSNAELRDPTVAAADDSETSYSITSSGAITGVNCVGGAVGYAINSTISNVKASAKLTGNANVGGLVGRAELSSIIGNLVEIAEDKENGNIRAVYYKYYDNKANLVATYIPTNIGGLVGEVKLSTISDNKLTNVYIASANEGSDNEGTMISINANYVYKDADASYTGEEKDLVTFNEMKTGFGGFIGSLDVLDTNIKDNTINMVNINAQLGVNVGTFYGYLRNWEIEDLPTDSKLGVKISAITSTNSGSGQAQTASNSSNDIKIDGSYFVGGIVGNYGAAGSTISGISNETIGTAGTIQLQTRIEGFYVGGYFGRFEGFVGDGSTKGMELTVAGSNKTGVKIELNNVYYAGGLIGQYVMSEVIDGVEFNGDVQIDQYSIGITGAKHDNFGGLIGMLKVTDKSTNSVDIRGSHYMPFTINTIENQNYKDGESHVEAAKSKEANIELYARAHYINLDTFNIQGTSSEAWHSVTATNPLNSNAKGWSKEYTGFRILQRCIPQQNVKVGDSIAVVYDAKNITHVATAENTLSKEKVLVKDEKDKVIYDYNGYKILIKTGLSDTANVEFEATKLGFKDLHSEISDGKEQGETKGDLYVWVKDDYILYTVYEEEVGHPKLYSRVGIATPTFNDDMSGIKGEYQYWEWTGSNYDHKSTGSDIEINPKKNITVNDAIQHFTKRKDKIKPDKGDIIIRKVEAQKDGEGTENVDNYYMAVAYYDGLKWIEFTYVTSTQETAEGENEATREIVKIDKWNNKISYYAATDEGFGIVRLSIPNYLAGDPYYAGDAPFEIDYNGKISNTMNYAHFEYDVLYDNATISRNDDSLPNSGSVFSVGGRISYDPADMWKNSAWSAIKDWAGDIFVGASITFGIALSVLLAAVLITAIPAGVAMVMSITSIVVGGVSLTTMFVSGPMNLIGRAVLGEHSDMILYENYSEGLFLNQQGQSFGLLGSMGAMELNYNEQNELVISPDDSYNDLKYGTFYAPYSTERPSDYHTHTAIMEYDTSGFIRTSIQPKSDWIDSGMPYQNSQGAEITQIPENYYTKGKLTGLNRDLYIYREGKYWILKSVGTTINVPVSINTPTIDEKLADQNLYRYNNGKLYVYGDYQSDQYNIASGDHPFGDNLITTSDRGKTYQFLGETMTDSDAPTYEDKVTFQLDSISEEELKLMAEGYEYIKKNTYLTTNGTYTSDYYILFNMSGESTTDTPGADEYYISYYKQIGTDDNDKPIYETRYQKYTYTITQNPNSGAEETNINEFKQDPSETTEPKELYKVRLYYTIEYSKWHNLGSQTYRAVSEADGFNIQQDVMFFRYENFGYIKETDGEKTKYNYAREVSYGENDTIILYKYKDNDDNIEEIPYSKFCKDFTTYSSWYIESEGNRIQVARLYNVVQHGTEYRLYIRDDSYFINNSAGSLGMESQHVQLNIMTDKLEANRYLSGSEKNKFYTRYKYTTDNGSSWDISKYEQEIDGIKYKFDQPNERKVVKLVERVQCTIGMAENQKIYHNSSTTNGLSHEKSSGVFVY